jgi:hypothetical protein
MTLRDKVREEFDSDIIEVCAPRQEIRVYYMHDNRGVDWVPFGGGPLYGESARDWALCKAVQLETYRSLLPKACRDWKVVYGVLETRTFPGVFHPVARPTAKAEVVL